MGIKVAKFGGSSLASAEQFRKVKEILLLDADRRIVVPSAPGKRCSTDIKVTDLFYECNRLAAAGKDIAPAFDRIRERYHGIAGELGLTADLDAHLEEVQKNIQLGAGADYAASRGEYLNGILLADYMGWDFVDPQTGIFFDEEGRLDSAKTQDVLGAILREHTHAVVPGFYGCDSHGNVKTFSRGGSDITGAIVA
ncbi:MAG: aspartate kinase, partial [Candidatus Ventricola sp.]